MCLVCGESGIRRDPAHREKAAVNGAQSIDCNPRSPTARDWGTRIGRIRVKQVLLTTPNSAPQTKTVCGDPGKDVWGPVRSG